MTRLFTAYFWLTICCMASVAAAGDLQTDLRNAYLKLDQGIRLLETDEAKAQPTLESSAAMIQAAMDDHQFESASAYHALGNAYMLSDQLGLAVLAYRKGQQLDPTLYELNDSLEQARSLVTLSTQPSLSNRIVSLLLIWRGYIPRSLMWSVSVTLFTLGWLSFSVYLLRPVPTRVRSLGVSFVVLSLIPASLLATEWIVHQGGSDCVLIKPDVLARSGPDDRIYDPVYSIPLAAGIEAVLISSKDTWSQLQLADGTQCWVPSASIALVNP